MDLSKIILLNDYRKCMHERKKIEFKIGSILNDKSLLTTEYDESFLNLSFSDPFEVFAFLFVDGFPNLEREIIYDFSNLSRLYLTHCMYLDDIIDNEANALLSFRANLYLEEAIKILTKYFHVKHVFWDYYFKYKKQYIQYNFFEKEIQLSIDMYTEDVMQKLSIGKSALTKIVPVSLALLSEKESIIKNIEVSQDYFNIANQYIDDLKDWKKDFKKKNHSYILCQCYKKLGLHPDDLSLDDQETIGKIMYFEGFANQNLTNAVYYYQKSQDEVFDLSFNQWKLIISGYLRDTIDLQSDLEELKNKELRKIKKYYNNSIKVNFSNIKEGLNKGIQYLISSQKEDGRWIDFYMKPGHSDVWITAYVGEKINNIKDHQARRAVKKAKTFLLKRLVDFNYTGWGYNLNTCIDSDSTAQAMLFLKEELKEGEIKKIISNLLNQQCVDGGFSTYSLKKINLEINRRSPFFGGDADYKGWCSSHQSVSAVVGLVLKNSTYTKNQELSKLINYLCNQYQDGYWHGYWWDDIFYPTYYCLQMLELYCKIDYESINTKIITMQEEDGGWHNGYEAGESVAFYTALAIKILLMNKKSDEKIKTAVNKGLKWLFQNQLNDGSWESYPLMRTPYSTHIKPWLDRENYRNGRKGNMMVDFYRNFTVSTVVSLFHELQTEKFVL